mgnify:CR=1 FL=1
MFTLTEHITRYIKDRYVLGATFSKLMTLAKKS